MEIKSIQPTAKFKADLANGQQLEVEVGYVSIGLEGADYAENGRMGKFSKLVKGTLIEAVTGWNLVDKDSGENIPCTLENRKDYLPILLGMELKDQGSVFGLELWGFATTSENFLKN